MGKLTDKALRAMKPQDRIYNAADGDGLSIQVWPNGGMYWRFRYRYSNKAKMLSLGVYPAVPIKEARERLADARLQQADERLGLGRLDGARLLAAASLALDPERPHRSPFELAHRLLELGGALHVDPAALAPGLLCRRAGRDGERDHRRHQRCLHGDGERSRAPARLTASVQPCGCSSQNA